VTRPGEQFRYQPPERHCVDAPGAALVVLSCPPWLAPYEQQQTAQPHLVLGITEGNCVHVDAEHVPQLLWEIAVRTGDPYAAINKLIEVSVQRAGEDTTPAP
jgi:hypothetical protein